MGGFFSALFAGKNDVLNTDIGKMGQISGSAIGTGESSIQTGTDFDKAIVSGDATKTTQAIAPVLNAAKTSNQQTQKSNTEMGTRSGGTAATNAASSDKLHSDTTNLIGSLTGKAADTLLSSGSGLLSLGADSTNSEAALSQQRYQNWSDSIFGKGITTAAATGEADLLGA